MTVNTAYLGLSNQTTAFTSQLSVHGDSVFSGTMTVGDNSGVSLVVGSAASKAPTSTLNVQGARFLSRLTTASATSLILRDGEFAVMFHSGNSCRLCFRSGNSTYTWIATTGGVL
jgi:hypothetical protein